MWAIIVSVPETSCLPLTFSCFCSWLPLLLLFVCSGAVRNYGVSRFGCNSIRTFYECNQFICLRECAFKRLYANLLEREIELKELIDTPQRLCFECLWVLLVIDVLGRQSGSCCLNFSYRRCWINMGWLPS